MKWLIKTAQTQDAISETSM